LRLRGEHLRAAFVGFVEPLDAARRRRRGMFRLLGGAIGIIFLIGLLVVIGLLTLIF
jgi:hypothetical protein